MVCKHNCKFYLLQLKSWIFRNGIYFYFINSQYALDETQYFISLCGRKNKYFKNIFAQCIPSLDLSKGHNTQLQHRKFFMSSLEKKFLIIFLFSPLFLLLNYILVWQKGHRHGASSSSIRNIHTVIVSKKKL